MASSVTAAQLTAARSELPGQRRHTQGPMLQRPLPQGPSEWLAAKQQRDGGDRSVAQLWRIEGQLYDLQGFQHPGGPSWLRVTQGTDCTAAFVTHHLDQPRVRAILAKYRVAGQGQVPQEAAELADGFSWQPQGFYLTLQRRGWQALRAAEPQAAQPTGPTRQMRALSWLLVAGCLAALLATAVTGQLRVAFMAGLFLRKWERGEKWGCGVAIDSHP